MAAVSLALSNVVIGALMDSGTVFSVSFLVMILAGLVVFLELPREVAIGGGAIIAGVFITDLIAALGFLSFIPPSFYYYSNWFLALALSVTGTVLIFRAWKNIQEPLITDKWRRPKTIAVLGFLIGAFIGMVQLPATGQIYIHILSRINSGASVTSWLSPLLLYEIVRMTPIALAVSLSALFSRPAISQAGIFPRVMGGGAATVFYGLAFFYIGPMMSVIPGGTPEIGRLLGFGVYAVNIVIAAYLLYRDI